jgi:long-chain acyl-CoA synthetase
MADPFSFLPLSIAAHGGRIDGFEAQQLVAAGLTLLKRSAPLVRALSAKRSAILLPTSPMFLVALAASEGRGAVLINPLASPFEIAHQLADARVGAVFTNAALARSLPASIPQVLLDDAPARAAVLIDGTAREVDLGAHLGMPIEGNADAAGSDDECVIVYTSAMAGRPLGAMLAHRNLLANARSTIVVANISSADRVLAVLPYSHLFGLTATCSAPLLAGADVVTMSRFNPVRATEVITAEGITQLFGVPSVFRALLSVIERFENPIRTLQICVCGGAPLAVSLQDRWFEATGVELRQGYGLTEAGPVCLSNRFDRPNVRGSLGVPLPGVDVELFEPIAYDDAGKALIRETHSSPLLEGEIAVRGGNVFRGYVSNGSAGLPVCDGWLRTGDRGRRNPDGTISFVGLVKPMFTRNGFNIYPHELERAIEEMPGIAHARVTEVATSTDREPEIALDVEGDVSEEDVKRWSAERLSVYKQPTTILIR